MDPVRPLRRVLDDLVGAGAGAGETQRALKAAGHGDLPPDLLAQAVVSYAAAAPPEVAEHLAPFVTACSPAAVVEPGPGRVDPDIGLELLATAPAGEPDAAGDADDGAEVLDDAGVPDDAGVLAGTPATEADDGGEDLDFGAGQHRSADSAVPVEDDVPFAGDQVAADLAAADQGELAGAADADADGAPDPAPEHEFSGLDLDPGDSLDAGPFPAGAPEPGEEPDGDLPPW